MSWTITGRGIAVGPLDIDGPAAAAYSLRNLSANFTGNVVRVRRSSDNAEQDFTAAQVTDGTLITFCGAGNGFVRTWYDQSGNGYHQQQATTSPNRQPQIVSSGTLILENSKPALQFDGTAGCLQATSVTLPAHIFATVVAKSTRTGSNIKFWLEQSANSGVNDGFYFNGTNDGAWNIRRTANHFGPSLDGTDWIGGSQALASLIYDGTGSVYKNSVFVTNATHSGTARSNTNVTAALNMGSRNQAGSFLTANMQEIIIYPAATGTASRAAVEANINAYYAIY